MAIAVTTAVNVTIYVILLFFYINLYMLEIFDFIGDKRKSCIMLQQFSTESIALSGRGTSLRSKSKVKIQKSKVIK